MVKLPTENKKAKLSFAQIPTQSGKNKRSENNKAKGFDL
jgi:hypothetical protein